LVYLPTSCLPYFLNGVDSMKKSYALTGLLLAALAAGCAEQRAAHPDFDAQ